MLGSSRSRSKSQSRLIRCVRETCFIVGDLPFTTIFNTASLSSTKTILVHDLGSRSGANEGGTQSVNSKETQSYLPKAESFRDEKVRLLPTVRPLAEKHSTMCSHRCRVGRPSILTMVSRATTSASVLLCDTEPCFLQIQDKGTKVFSPTKHSTPPVVERESFRSPAKEASLYTASLSLSMGSPTSDFITKCLVVLI